MLDPNPDIEGHGISLLQRNNVEVDFFDLDLVQMIREENKEFIAQYQKSSEQSENATGVFEGPSSKEKEIVPAASTKELDNDLIGEYLLARGQELTIPSKELWEFLSRNALVHLDNRSGKYIPTVAGLLLFGKNPEDFLVQSKIKAEVNQGGKTKVFDLKGPLVSLVAAVQSFLEENMRTYTEIREFKRVEVPEYPWEAMREAIINAIVHRDYVEGARVFVRLSDDSLIIKSPGLPLQPLSLAKIQAYNAPPYSRNPRIADTFYHFALMEERGWGLGRMRDVLTQHGLPPPRFSYDGNYFVVTFSGNRQHGGTLQVGADLLASLDDRLRKIVVIVEEKGRITSLECAKKLRVDRSTAIRSLNKLQKHGVLEKKGRGATVYYVLGSGR
jgi:ATP-dependent DNA helicase RecG